ncbi:cation transporter [uncultured Cellulomonas sp.]|uniref:cation transporter n=1 Tax=uncultured Cellulomonas sp. TaxID=189682 RepID=UPI00261ED2E1|nr:cation transporter [uncultured Cellulomonas sp.]
MTLRTLPLTDVSTTTGAGCGCCSPSGTTTPAPHAPTAATGVVTAYGIAGMTCGHCVAAVGRGIGALDGVTGVETALVAGGVSTVTVTSRAPVDDAAVADAVVGAGYRLTGRLP